MYSRKCTFGTKVGKSNIRVERWHKYEILNSIEKTRLFFKRFAYVQSYCITG